MGENPLQRIPIGVSFPTLWTMPSPYANYSHLGGRRLVSTPSTDDALSEAWLGIALCNYWNNHT